jgi:hypothetical protein
MRHHAHDTHAHTQTRTHTHTHTHKQVCDITLPTLPKRLNLEDLGQIEPRVSALDDDLQSACVHEKKIKNIYIGQIEPHASVRDDDL